MKLTDPIINAIKNCYDDVDATDLPTSAPPNLELGDIAVPMFALAKKQRQAPQKIASAIAEQIGNNEFIASVTATGPYVNFKLNRNHVGAEIIEAILEKKTAWGSNASGEGQKVLIEHTSINPNASPHVGRRPLRP